MALVMSVLVMGLLDIYALWPLLLATAGGWAAVMMTVVLLLEGSAVVGELKAL